ncbi:hypothetical protein EV174_004069 [Coemansia sp. RSA 2320]|nr:hypothetical protein EV174_004069 [Coemansia sp. RSA 2320]
MADSQRDSRSPAPARTGRGAKPHVRSACTNCKKAHLACDLQRPCRRCVSSGKCDTCKDVQHKKRGRPRSKDKKAPGPVSAMDAHMFQFPCAEPPTSYLFVTPELRCLRLEEEPHALLGYALLSLVNRSLTDFVSDADCPAVLAAFAALRHQLGCRTPPTHARTIDPAAFHTLPAASLLCRAAPDAYVDVRVRLRMVSGAYGQFFMHIYAGATPTEPLSDTYYVCRIQRLDFLPSPDSDALSMASSWSSKLSTVSSSPTLTAVEPRPAALPSLAELLKSLDASHAPRFWPPAFDSSHCTSP